MDEKIEVKEEEPLADDVASLNEREFLHEVGPMNTSINTVLVDTDCNMTAETEVNSETSFIKHSVEQVKTESAICSNNWEMHGETEIEHPTLCSDFGSENAGEFLLEDPLKVDNKYNRDDEMYNKIEIKGEPWTLEREPSSVSDDIKDAVLSPVKSLRLYPETVPVATLGKSPLFSAEIPTRDTSFCNGTNHLEYDHQKYVSCDVLTARTYVHSDQYGIHSDGVDTSIGPIFFKHRSLSDMSNTTEQYGIRSDGVDTSIGPIFFKHRSLSDMSNTTEQCSTYEKRFNLNLQDKRSFQCNVCDKRYSHLNTLRRHYLVHEGKKEHKCTVCDKAFTTLSYLKTHYLIHEGKNHECKVCGKRFTQFIHLKMHNLIHEGKRPHQCTVCGKNFRLPSDLKSHNLIHERKRSHHCKVCGNSYIRLSDLKKHNFIHEGKKPYQCKVCDKRFTQLSNLKRHILIHER